MKQLDLFDYTSNSINKQPTIKMSKDSLENWKNRIFKHQQEVITQESSIEQLTLFDLDSCSNRFSADKINPFVLKLHNCEFYEHNPQQLEDENCLHFIIDNTIPLLLYIGESKNSPRKRWKGTHDCKNYIFNYIELHRKYLTG